MPTIPVATASITVRSIKLTRNVLKQLGEITLRKALPIFKGQEPGEVLGWIHGSVLGQDTQHILLLKLPEVSIAAFRYVRYRCSSDTAKKYPQLFIE